MAVDRYKMEQEAQRYLSKGNTDKAITTYAALLRQDPQDRRVRQKIAGLYETIGRTREAEKHYRELVKLYDADGNDRARMATLKQLRKLAPRDGEVMGLLARAYRASDLPRESIRHYEQAINLLGQREPKEAAVFAQELQELMPGDTPLRLKTAELLAKGKDEKGAYKAYRELIDDLRRHGKLNEVGRVAAMALQLKPEESDLLCDAAESALAGGEPQTALTHLHPAYQENPHEPRTLDLLARVFEEQEEIDKAKGVLLTLATELAARADHDGRLAALERARKITGDTGLDRQIGQARASAEAAHFRLGDLSGAQPHDEAELRAIVRANVMLRYGLTDRALQELETLAEESLARRAWTVEVAVARGETGRALELGRALQEAVSADEARMVRLRIAVLNAEDLEPYLPDLSSSAGGGADPDDDLLGDELLDDDLLDDDLLDDELLDDDLLDDDLLDDDLLDDDLLDEDSDTVDTDSSEEVVDEPEAAEPASVDDEAAAFFADDAAAASPPPSAGGGDLLGDLFGDLTPSPTPTRERAGPGKVPEFGVPEEDEFSAAIRRGTSSEAGEDHAEDPLADIRALIDMGLYEAAQEALAGQEGLRVVALRALCRAGRGELGKARGDLVDAVDDADESNPELPEALFHLASLSARSAKRRRAIRQLKEVVELAPHFRPVEVQIRLRALEELDRS